MTPEQTQQVKQLFDVAFDLEPAAQADLLASHDGDSVVRAEVEKLLRLSGEAGDFLEGRPLSHESFDSAAAIGHRIGNYRVIREIGSGGMGAVFLAERTDGAYTQQVAVKLVGPGFGGELAQRFRREREILARLNHPHIARLLDGGATEEGWHYLVMEYVEGQSITAYCREHKLSIPARLQLFRKVCAAVQYAHQNLVIHRDLKPSNILVTRDGAPKLLDFGIAKLLDRGNDPSTLTRTGFLPFTPLYASPEQVRNQSITTASDVYSLGVLLYEMLTGVKPYRTESDFTTDILRAVCEEEPERPSARASRNAESLTHFGETTMARWQSRLRGDLDNIVCKALQKDVRLRYLTVEEFSDDLQNHLNGQPVTARQPTPMYRTGKLIRRHKMATGLLLLMLFIGFGALLWQVQARRESAREQRRVSYPATISKANSALENGRLDHYQATLESCLPPLGEEDMRGFEWYYLWRQSHRESLINQHPAAIGHAYFVRGGARIYSHSLDGTCKVWETATGDELAVWKSDIKNSRVNDLDGYGLSDGLGSLKLAVIENENTVKVFDVESAHLLYQINDPVAPIRLVNFLPGGRQLITSDDDGMMKFWDLEAGRSHLSLQSLIGPVINVFISIDGRRMLTNIANRHVQLWDLTRGRVLATYPAVVNSALRFVADGKWFWMVDGGRKLMLCDSATGRTLGTVVATGERINSNSTLDSRRLYLGGDAGTVKIYEMPALRLLALFKAHVSEIHHVRLSPDGKLLATTDGAGELKLWESATLRELVKINRTASGFCRLTFSPDGRKLMAGNQDGVVQVWEVASLLNEASVLRGHDGRVYSASFSPNGRRIATASVDRTIKLWDAQTGALQQTLTGHSHQVLCTVFSPDGNRLASASSDGTARLWDAATGRLLFKLDHPIQTHTVAFSPDGKWLATGCDDQLIRIWNASTGELVRTLAGHSGTVWTVAFSPDGRTLASGGCDKTVKLWDTTTGRVDTTLSGHSDCVWSVVFSRDGQQLVTGSTDRTAKLWDLATQQAVRNFSGHMDEIFEVELSPDGKRLATASNDNTVKLWNLATGQELLTLKDHTDQVWSVTFSPDGNTLASGSWDGTVRLWRAATDKEAGTHRSR